MKKKPVTIAGKAPSPVETLEYAQDLMLTENIRLLTELRAARHEDLAGEFKPWKPRAKKALSGPNSLPKNATKRRLGARGLQKFQGNRGIVGPVPSPGGSSTDC
jgi:hypothetical protein